MNNGEIPSQAEKMNPDDPSELDPKLLDKIKHPPAIDQAMRKLDPQELRANPAISPEMIQEGEDLRSDLTGKD